MKKIFRTLGYSLLAILVAANLYLIVSGKTWVYRALIYNYVDIDDNDLFSQRPVPMGTGQDWPLAKGYNKAPMPEKLQKMLDSLKSVAFVVIKDDSLLYENYWENYSDSSLSNSFSMAKSFVGLMTGIAIDKGFIKSIDEPVSNYIPEFATGKRKVLTIRHLLTMSADLNWDESYSSLMSKTTEAYYGTDLYKQVTVLDVVNAPGKDFNYQSCCTQLLSIIIEKATGQTLSQFASENIWKPVHAMHGAEWSLDHENGIEKAYCCFYSNARDFARIGDLYFHQGNWRGTQVVDSAWVKESITPAPLNDEGEPNTVYGYQWWMNDYNGTHIFNCRGLNGQYVVCIPDQHIIFVRLGHKRAKAEDGKLLDLPVYVQETLNWVKAAQ